jgi:signal transduction histidine kinase
MPGGESAQRVVIIAPLGQDASAIATLLESHGYRAAPCDGAAEAASLVAGGAGALLLTEEALEDAGMPALLGLLQEQPPWSELPLIILTSGGESRVVRLLDIAAAAAGSITVMERPIAAATLLQTVEVALRSRRRQYQVRDLLQRLHESTREAEAARREAEAASQAKDDFIAALSHELRTPLSPVLMAAAEMESDPLLPDVVRSEFTMIRRNIELEARLIDDLLDLTRIRRGLLHIDAGPCDVHELLQRAEDIVRSDVRSKSIGFEFLPGAREHHVTGDPARLQQVFWNLLKNAIKFTAEGGRVTIKTRNPASGALEIRVEDTGVGISPAVMERIFNAFDQGELKGRHRFGGLGLGLSISKAIIDAHDGELRAFSDGPGKGATFTIGLKTTVPAARRPENGPATPRACPGKSCRLLYVEDHRETLAAVTELLERDGHRIFGARTVREALLQAEKNECDMVLSDLGLPDGTGFDLMSEIRRRYGWPGIAISGFGMNPDLRESEAAGFVRHLIKPIDIATLRQTIQEVAGLKPA